MEKRQQLTTEGKPSKKWQTEIVKSSFGKKIKDFSESEQEDNNGKLITRLLSMLGVTDVNESKTSHYAMVDEALSTDYNNYTYSEIIKAFKMLIKGDFNDMPIMKGYKLFSKLDCIILGKAMQCYQIKRKDHLKRYRAHKDRELLIEQSKTEISEDEKRQNSISFITKCFESFKNEDGIFIGFTSFYPELRDQAINNQILEFDDKLKNQIRNKAFKNVAIQNKESSGISEVLKNNIEQNTLEVEMKKIITQMIFKKIIDQEMDFEKIANNIYKK